MSESTTCGSCGNALLPTDAFCSGCGIPVRTRGIDAGAERRTIINEAVPTAQRRHCGSCNAPLFAGDSFCAACGSTLAAAAEEASLPESSARLKTRIEEASQGRYRIVREIGRGGMGVVFLAEDSDLSRRVAIKVLSGGGNDPSTLERFEREARTVAQLRHEAIVRVHAVGNLDDLHYFVMDYVAGVSLQKILAARGKMPIPMIEAVLFRVGVGLAYAHTKPAPVVHRDIKPSNILVDTEGQVTLMDFGVAKVGDDSVGLTRTGMILGTPEYMSPEQVRSQPVTPSTDQYALGAVVFAMLTGRPPFSGPFYQVLIAHQGEPIPDIREARPDAPETLVAAVEKMLAKDPAERWPDLPTLLRHLDLRPLSPYDATVKEMSELVTSLYHAEIEDAAAASYAGTPSTASRLRIALGSDHVEVGDSVTLDVSLLFPDGKVSPAGDLSWSSDPPGIVQMDSETGELVAVGAGVTRLTARGGGVDASVEVQVSPPEVASVSILPKSVSLEPGEVALLEGVTLSRSGRPLDHPRTWASSDPGVVTVSPTGELRAVRAGAASVVLYCDSGWAAVAVKVNEEAATPSVAAASTTPTVAPPTAGPPPPPPPRAAAPSGASTPAAGSTASSTSAASTSGASTPSLKADPSESTAIQPAARGVISRRRSTVAAAARELPRHWIAAAAGAVVVVGGLAWALSRDDAPAPAPLDGELAVLTPTGAPPAEGLALAPGETVDLRLEVPSTSTGEAGDATWTSSAPDVVSVTDGRVVAGSPGAAEVTVVLAGMSATIPVRVATTFSALALRAANGAALGGGSLTLTEGESAAVSALLVDASDAVVNGPPAEWTAADPGVATFSGGRVRAVGPGVTVLTARAGGFESTLRVTVDAAPVTPTPQQAQPTAPTQAAPEPPAARTPTPAAPEAAGRGTLVIVVTPGWANAFLDGQPIGEYKTSYQIELDAGSYQIRLENPAFVPADTTLTIRPGQVTRWERRLGNGSDS